MIGKTEDEDFEVEEELEELMLAVGKAPADDEGKLLVEP